MNVSNRQKILDHHYKEGNNWFNRGKIFTLLKDSEAADYCFHQAWERAKDIAAMEKQFSVNGKKIKTQPRKKKVRLSDDLIEIIHNPERGQ